MTFRFGCFQVLYVYQASVSPNLILDSLHGKIINLASKRIYLPVNSRDSDDLMVYIGDIDSVFMDASKWNLIGNIKRNEPTVGAKVNTANFYGYPTATWIDDTTLFVIITDDSNLNTTQQQAALYQFAITYHQPLEVNTITNNNSTTLYPNPANNYITLKYENYQSAQAIITDIFGRKFQSFFIDKGLTNISTTDLPAGSYILSLLTGKEILRKQFIVIH